MRFIDKFVYGISGLVPLCFGRLPLAIHGAQDADQVDGADQGKQQG